MKIEQFITTLKDNPVKMYDDDKNNSPLIYKGPGKDIPPKYHTKSILAMNLGLDNNKPVILLHCVDNLARKAHIGKTNVSYTGRDMTIVDYESNANITVQFDDGVILKKQKLDAFRTGHIQHPDDDESYQQQSSNKKNERIGLSFKQTNGTFTIIDYITSDDMTVRFDDGTVVYGVSWNQIKNGTVQKLDLNTFDWTITDQYDVSKNITWEEALHYCEQDDIPSGDRWRKRRISFLFKPSHSWRIFLRIMYKGNMFVITRKRPLSASTKERRQKHNVNNSNT